MEGWKEGDGRHGGRKNGWTGEEGSDKGREIGKKGRRKIGFHCKTLLKNSVLGKLKFTANPRQRYTALPIIIFVLNWALTLLQDHGRRGL